LLNKCKKTHFLNGILNDLNLIKVYQCHAP
jgi:hypothetical protein